MSARILPYPPRRPAAQIARMDAHAARDAAARAWGTPRAVQPLRSYGTAQPFAPAFVMGRANTCPCCHASAWHVRQSSAECARCGNALVVVRLTSRPTGPAENATPDDVSPLRRVWQSMPRSERIGMFAFPPLFLALGWAVWVMLP